MSILQRRKTLIRVKVYHHQTIIAWLQIIILVVDEEMNCEMTKVDLELVIESHLRTSVMWIPVKRSQYNSSQKRVEVLEHHLLVKVCIILSMSHHIITRKRGRAYTTCDNHWLNMISYKLPCTPTFTQHKSISNESG